MSRKFVLSLVVILLLAGAVAVAIINGSNSEEEAGADEGIEGTASGTRATLTGDDSEGSKARKSVERSEREIKDEELVARYGEVRTALSRKVAKDVVSLLDDAVAMGEMMTEGAGQAFGGGRRGMMRGALGRIGLELDEDQEAKAMELYAKYQKREVTKTKTAVDSLRKDSTALMELFLAGDAKERGEMDDAEYALVQADVAGRMPDVINPLDRNNFRGGQPLQDDELMGEFKAILNEDQTSTFDTYLAEQSASAEAAAIPEGNIANVPTMELDTLDGAIGSAKKMTEGFRSVMEGMGGLQDLRPKLEGE